MLNLFKKEFLIFIAVILLALPMMTAIDANLYEVFKTIMWLIAWFYMFKSYSIDKKWVVLFLLPVMLYNPFIKLGFSTDIWSLLNGFFLVIFISWLLKMFRLNSLKTSKN